VQNEKNNNFLWVRESESDKERERNEKLIKNFSTHPALLILLWYRFITAAAVADADTDVVVVLKLDWISFP
jgi:hypothetical protein